MKVKFINSNKLEFAIKITSLVIVLACLVIDLSVAFLGKGIDISMFQNGDKTAPLIYGFYVFLESILFGSLPQIVEFEIIQSLIFELVLIFLITLSFIRREKDYWLFVLITAFSLYLIIRTIYRIENHPFYQIVTCSLMLILCSPFYFYKGFINKEEMDYKSTSIYLLVSFLTWLTIYICGYLFSPYILLLGNNTKIETLLVDNIRANFFLKSPSVITLFFLISLVSFIPLLILKIKIKKQIETY